MGKIILVLLVAGIGIWLLSGLFPVDMADTKPVQISIESGSSVNTIAKQLYDKRLIRSPFIFKLYVRYQGLTSLLKAGSYSISPSQSAAAIAKTLAEGKSEEIVITVPEGYSVADIDALMASKGLGQPGDILECARHCDFATFDFLPRRTAVQEATALSVGPYLEGYLFPDTYYVSTAGYQPKFFLERMLGTFRSKIVTPYGAEAAESGHTMNDILIMASMVQDESRGDEDERGTVAGILWNRLKNGTLLGVDATVRYALRKPREPLTRTDLDLDSPYNTRKEAGLPPTPIANPGEQAIVAALRPKTTDYWYYLHDAQGVIHYARTNDEHNANRARYLR